MLKSYNNLKIKSKMLLSFALMALLAILIGGVGIIGMGMLQAEDEEMYTENTQPMGELASMYDTLASQRICAANMVIFHSANPEFAEEEFAALAEKEELFETAFAAYKETITTPEEQTLYDEMNRLYFGDFVGIKQNVRDAYTAGDEAAMAEAMKQIDDMGAEISGYMDEAFALNVAAAQEKVNNNNTLALTSRIVQIVVMALGVALAVFCAFFLADLLAKPLGRIMSATKQVSDTGNMDFSDEMISQIKKDAQSKDEIGQTARSFATMMDSLIANTKLLERVAEGDLSVDVTKASEVDTMGNALEKMVSNLNNMFGEVNTATDQVSVGSHQIADGAQALSQGATEQASAVEELSASIAQVLSQTQENTHNAEEALEFVNQAGQDMQNSTEYMQMMQKAMDGISSSSEEIAKVIKVIDDIAFQTNILALNAAVEAARAGQHGKGFAVVADEVRNLASKSAEAAKETASLIQTSVDHVQEGSDIANKTNESVQKVVESAQKTQEKIVEINGASKQQEEAITQINVGIEQISTVVQTNSATAEESAASSEELSGQAQMLKQLVGRFRLKDIYSSTLLGSAPAQVQLPSYNTPQAPMGEEIF
ncbi:methyl-accepting chemotaxis protein [Ruminococcaceae bacterium OttesenSCG-928-I18]|nr:methyl-accepting chemotaxis protein [Ruminococcaceae bacterium OttesenSCG-928-I18]